MAEKSSREAGRRRGSEAGDADRVLLRREPKARLVVARPEATAVSLLAVVGAAFLIVGLTDLALLWWPLGFGDSAWEFGTLSHTFDSVPMTGLGLALVTYAIVRHPGTRPGWVRGLAVFYGVAAVGLIALGLIYATAAPVVIRQTPPGASGAIRRAVLKSAVQIVIYSVGCVVIAIMFWRGVRKSPQR